MKKIWIKVICVLAALALLGGIGVLAVNGYVKRTAKPWLLTAEEAAALDADCVLVLGCGVRPNGEPSLMLRDRLETGLALYELGAAPKLLMSGDHSRKDYDEVNAMKDFAMEAGVPSQDVFMDHAGFSTYESMYRAKEVFQAEKIIIVTQEYHLYRAIYIAESLGLEAYGVSSDYRAYSGQTAMDLREMLARVKDFGTAIFKPAPTYGGKVIPISGNGDLTNDEA